MFQAVAEDRWSRWCASVSSATRAAGKAWPRAERANSGGAGQRGPIGVGRGRARLYKQRFARARPDDAW